MAQFHLPESIERARQLLESQSLHPLELGMLPVESTLFPLCCGSFKHALLVSQAYIHARPAIVLGQLPAM